MEEIYNSLSKKLDLIKIGEVKNVDLLPDYSISTYKYTNTVIIKIPKLWLYLRADSLVIEGLNDEHVIINYGKYSTAEDLGTEAIRILFN